MAVQFQFEHSVGFSAKDSGEILRSIPALPGVFALFGPRASVGESEAQPYLTRTADLRRRVTRMLAPPESQSKRLNLRNRVARIEYTVTGSEFESTLALYHASAAIFGLDQARRRLKLRTPFFLRFTAENAYPRVYSTNRLSRRALGSLYGPFPSRAAADRYCDAVLDLFKLRRCFEDLAPYPEHPGCVYQEMKKCLAPCNQACTPAGAAAYAAEAAAVQAFFETHGESRMSEIAHQREEASAAMEFERAAELHAQWQKAKAAAALAAPLVEPVPRLRAVIVQKAAQTGSESEPCAAVYLLESGCLSGPARLSILGVRAVREQTAVGSSLFAQPLMLEAVPLDGPASPESNAASSRAVDPVLAREAGGVEPEAPKAASLDAPVATASVGEVSAAAALHPEARAAAAIAGLEEQASAPADLNTLSDHLSLLRRWYYRPEKQRVGEICLPKEDGAWPIRRILNSAARMALGDPRPMAETQRDLAVRNPAEPELKPARTKVLHAGRPEVERTVPVIGGPRTSRRKRTG